MPPAQQSFDWMRLIVPVLFVAAGLATYLVLKGPLLACLDGDERRERLGKFLDRCLLMVVLTMLVGGFVKWVQEFTLPIMVFAAIVALVSAISGLRQAAPTVPAGADKPADPK